MTSWNFLSNHGRTLTYVSRHGDARLRDIAEMLGVTERAAFGIVKDLTDAGYLLKVKEGRRNHYEIQHHLPIPESPDQTMAIGEVLQLLTRNCPTPGV
jgi:predicted transcriptional regulator of viral defense system